MPGTKRKRGKDSWLLEVCIGTDFTGKPNRYSKTVHGTEKQADKELAKFYAACEAGKVNKSNPITIADFAATYVSEYVNRHLKVSAKRGIDTALNIWIIPLLGTKKVSKLTRLDVQAWVNYLSEEQTGKDSKKKKLSPKSVHNYYSVLSGMMKFAIDMGVVEDTPCKNIRLPKKERKSVDYYDKEEVKALLKVLDTLPPDELKFKAAVYIALFGGLRKGEILGLDWDDVDFEAREITICRTRMIGPGRGVYEDTPKTEKSARTVVLPVEIIHMLQSLRIQQKEAKLFLGEKYEDSPAILRGDFGRPLYPQVLQRWFTNFIEKNSLPHITLHGLRHTHASMLTYMDADKMQVSTRLGHSQLSTTLNIYTHLFDRADDAIANELSTRFLESK